MSTPLRRKRLPALLVLVALLGLTAAAIAVADTIGPDNDVVTPGNQATRTLSAAPGDVVSTTQQLVLDYQGNKHVVAGSTVTASVDAAQTTLPAGYSVGSASIAVPNPWTTGGQATGISNIQFTAPATPGTYSYTVKWGASATCASGTGCVTGSNAMTIDLTVTAPVATNDAPTVKTAAADANGTEGDTLSASGAFEDADGDDLTLTADNAIGTFTDNGDGSWSWSLATDDDVPAGTITVTADDGNGGTVTDSFDYSAANADPELGSLSLGGSNCQPTLGFSFSDAGAADTHSGTIDWGDGSTDDVFTTSPVSQGHGYTGAGQYTIGVDVADDDGGTDSAQATHTVYNIPSGILQPVNSTGARSAFKLGSTIPVKITVASCGGGAVSTLAPEVKLVKLDSNPDGTESEPVSTASPTSGTTMRWDATGQQYIYNLGTKGLTVGDWKVRVYDGTFASPVEATFSLKK